MEINLNKIYQVKIDNYSHDGKGVGRIDNRPVFVANTVAGETINVRITAQKKGVFFGEVAEVITKSKNRVIPECPVYSKCGGCNISHLSYSAQLEMKENIVKNTLTRLGGMDNIDEIYTGIIPSPQTKMYRNKGIFHYRNGRFTFLEEGSDRAIGFSCKMLFSKNITNIVADLEKINFGNSLKWLMVRESSFNNDIILVFVYEKGKQNNLTEKIEEIPNIERIRGIGVSHAGLRDDATNAIYKGVEQIYGKLNLGDVIGDKKYLISPASFFQINKFNTVNLYDEVKNLANLTGIENILDIYCGSGTIGIYLSDNCKSIVGIESVKETILDANKNAKLNNVKNAKYIYGRAENVINDIANVKFDLIILDPPRKGCEASLLETIAKTTCKKIIYVSCNPSTLARDLKILTNLGFKTKAIKAIDMFPHSANLETICLIER